jgi:hypothetical protein
MSHGGGGEVGKMAKKCHVLFERPLKEKWNLFIRKVKLRQR